MFTGIVQATGSLRARPTASGATLAIEHPLGTLEAGESICVNGACLTVVSSDGAAFVAHASSETLACTTLGRPEGSRAGGARVNLERALRIGDRLGGHWVAGHVDTVGQVLEVSSSGEAKRVVFGLPEMLQPYVAPKGSITVDGVSLTVNTVDANAFSVMLVPHTLGVTTLGDLAPDHWVNLEADLLARYAVHALARGTTAEPAEAGLIRALGQAGFGTLSR